MSKVIDLTGQRFGKLKVISRYGTKRNRATWLCLCDCGKETIVTSDKLRSGHTKSCGCLISETAKNNLIDLTGGKFGRWLVIEKYGNENSGDTLWKCKCDCGRIKNIRGSSLTSGNSKSCGCLARELNSKRNRENYKPKKIEDLTGRRYGMLTVVKMCKHKSGEPVKWICKCDCGNEKIAKGVYLKNGKTSHCGCNKPYSYRLSYPRLYRIWTDMKQRCNNPNNDRAYDYGSRGIKVCKEWEYSFESFAKWALNNGYSDKLTLDRKDVNGNYEPSNCQWITSFAQMSNMRNNVNLKYNGEIQTLSEWCRRLNMNYGTISYRLKRGWSVEDAFEKPPQGK